MGLADRVIVTAAVRQHGPALEFASNDLIADYDLLLQATKNDVSACAGGRAPVTVSRGAPLPAFGAEMDQQPVLAVERMQAQARAPAQAPSDYDVLMGTFREIQTDLAD